MNNLAQMIKDQQAAGLQALLKHFGTQAEMANQLGESQQTVNNWFRRGRISATAAIKAEAATGIDKAALRPDVIKWGGK